MKKSCSILFFCLLFLTTLVAKNTEDFDPINDSRLDILIINSYAPDEIWSNGIMQKVEERLRKKYPNAHVHARNVGAAEELTGASYLLSLRHIFHSFLDEGTASLFQQMRYGDLFAGTIIPDVIIFLGSESFLFYQGASSFITKQWIDIPIIWTCVPDSVIVDNWRITPNTDFGNLCPPEARAKFKINVSQKTFRSIPEHNIQYVTDVTVKSSDTIYTIERDYNLTGVKTPPQIKENLELIKTLYPKVNEIVFIDEGIYTTDYIHKKLEQEINAILPDIRFTPVKHLKNINTDSLFHLMTHPVKGKVFLTYSFNINGYFSRYNDNIIDSLFQYTKVAPIFSLTNRSEAEKETFMIGGYYLENEPIVENTVGLTEKVLNKKDLQTIPFREVKQGYPILNKTIINRLGLSKKAKKLPNVVFYNQPIPFIEKYERQLFVSLIAIAIIAVAMLIVLRQRSYNKKLMKGFLRYKNLYNNLQIIYNYSTLTFILYEKNGLHYKSNLDENTRETESRNIFFCQNIFESEFLTLRERVQLKSGQAIFKEIELKENELKTFQFIVKPIEEKGFIAISIDTTPISSEQKQKEHLMSLLEFVFNTASIGILFYNIQTNHGYASQMWNTMMGGKTSFPPTYNNFKKEDRTIIQNFVRTIQHSENQQYLIREICITHENQENWFLLHIFNMPERKLIIELCIDITKQKQHEATLEIAKQEAELMNAEMKEFLANISHEIRTPLNAIIGFSEILVENQIPEDQALFSKIIETNNVLLVDIIENVLKLSEIDSGNVTKIGSHFDAISVLSNIAANVQFRIEKENVVIVKEFEEKELWIDTNLIYFNLLMTNLVLNATKFTEEGTITIGYKKEENKHVFYVKDTGIGISDEHKQLIFKRFYKVDTFTQGTGLGLALCKSITEFLDGELTFGSEYGKGSVFYFKL